MARGAVVLAEGLALLNANDEIRINNVRLSTRGVSRLPIESDADISGFGNEVTRINADNDAGFYRLRKVDATNLVQVTIQLSQSINPRQIWLYSDDTPFIGWADTDEPLNNYIAGVEYPIAFTTTLFNDGATASVSLVAPDADLATVEETFAGTVNDKAVTPEALIQLMDILHPIGSGLEVYGDPSVVDMRFWLPLSDGTVLYDGSLYPLLRASLVAENPAYARSNNRFVLPAAEGRMVRGAQAAQRAGVLLGRDTLALAANNMPLQTIDPHDHQQGGQSGSATTTLEDHDHIIPGHGHDADNVVIEPFTLRYNRVDRWGGQGDDDTSQRGQLVSGNMPDLQGQVWPIRAGTLDDFAYYLSYNKVPTQNISQFSVRPRVPFLIEDETEPSETIDKEVNIIDANSTSTREGGGQDLSLSVDVAGGVTQGPRNPLTVGNANPSSVSLIPSSVTAHKFIRCDYRPNP